MMRAGRWLLTTLAALLFGFVFLWLGIDARSPLPFWLRVAIGYIGLGLLLFVPIGLILAVVAAWRKPKPTPPDVSAEP